MQDLALIKSNLTYKTPFSSKPITGIKIWAGSYNNGRLALQLTAPVESEPELDEPFTTITVNLPELPCPPREIWVKDWAQNEGMVEWLIANKIVKSAPTEYASGHVDVRRFHLTPEFVTALVAACLSPRVRF